jgi:alkanesulfonate monooxygenase SsuD/methylene tetrahydromethanopterin reductase-like flavin-dependent oxidoreductase (luciferase family)
MKFSLTLTFNPADDQVPLAIAADELGFHSVNLGDGLFFYDETSVNYPYSDSGARYWNANTAFLDPFCAISHMGAVTRNIRFLISVLKLPVRQPMLVAKQAGTAAYFCQDRMTLGVGLSPWPEDFSVNGANWDDRGPRSEEMIEILRKALTGEMFEHNGKYYPNLPRMSINPAPKKHMPIVIGGTADIVLKRAARIADGFASPNTKADHIIEMAQKIAEYRKEYGTDNKPFEFISVATDVFDLAGNQKLSDNGVTEACVMPWFMYGGKFKSDIQFKIDCMKRFKEDVMDKMK